MYRKKYTINGVGGARLEENQEKKMIQKGEKTTFITCVGITNNERRDLFDDTHTKKK